MSKYLIAGLPLLVCSQAFAQAPSVTIYGSNGSGYALISRSQEANLESGLNRITLRDLGEQVDATTLTVRDEKSPNALEVLQYRYLPAQTKPGELLKDYLGKRIAVDMPGNNPPQRYSGTLLDTAPILLKTDKGELISLNQPANLILPPLGRELRMKPEYLVTLNSRRNGKRELRINYQTSGLGWRADYNLLWNGKNQQCRTDFSAWATFSNQSGADYQGAKVRLVAGEPNRVRMQAKARRGMASDMMMAESFAAAPAQQQAISGYHLYTLPTPVDLPDGETVQQPLLPAVAALPCRIEQTLQFTGAVRGYGREPNLQRQYSNIEQAPVMRTMHLDNRRNAGLNQPLPAGRVRVTQNPVGQSPLLIGEDRLGHTAAGTEVPIRLGKAFDIQAKRKQSVFRLEKRAKILEEGFEISLHNGSKQAQTVVVKEYPGRWSSWKVKSSSIDWKRSDAGTVEFTVTIPAGEKRRFEYRVQYDW